MNIKSERTGDKDSQGNAWQGPGLLKHIASAARALRARSLIASTTRLNAHNHRRFRSAPAPASPPHPASPSCQASLIPIDACSTDKQQDRPIERREMDTSSTSPHVLLFLPRPPLLSLSLSLRLISLVLRFVSSPLFYVLPRVQHTPVLYRSLARSRSGSLEKINRAVARLATLVFCTYTIHIRAIILIPDPRSHATQNLFRCRPGLGPVPFCSTWL